MDVWLQHGNRTARSHPHPPGSHHSTRKQVFLLKRVQTLIFKCWLISPHILCKRKSPHRPCLLWMAGYQAIWDWLGFLRHRQWATGGLWKGISLEPTRWHTHTPVCAGYHFTSRLCSVWSLEAPSRSIPLPALCDHITHNPLRSVIHRPALQEHIVTIGKGKRDSGYFIQMQKLFLCSLFFSHVNQRSFISVAVKSKALLSLLSKVGKAFLREQSKIQLSR